MSALPLAAASADSNKVCRNGQYPLRAAIMSGDMECVLALLSAKADVNLETSRGNPLGCAVQEADISVAELLLVSRH
jgi:ankyrin repeat protein